MTRDGDLSKLVNASGFAFQLGIEHEVRATTKNHSWRVVSREHPWSAGGDNQGFIDLVLAKGFVTAVVECKRARDGVWVFLIADGGGGQRTGSRALWTAGAEDGRGVSGYAWMHHLPETLTSSFCVVRGSGENDRPLLERLCSTLISSVDGLAEEEIGLLQRAGGGWKGFYLPIVVTNAELHVCRLAPNEVDLSDGTIGSAEFERVPFVRFQKAFSASPILGAPPTDLGSAAELRERTVWIVEATSLSAFLGSVKEPAYRDPYPWERVPPTF
jgi:hypothetical protein